MDNQTYAKLKKIYIYIKTCSHKQFLAHNEKLNTLMKQMDNKMKQTFKTSINSNSPILDFLFLVNTVLSFFYHSFFIVYISGIY